MIDFRSMGWYYLLIGSGGGVFVFDLEFALSSELWWLSHQPEEG